VVAEGDWRLMGQENWLGNRPVRWAAWSPYREGWDHDHCAFCSDEFAAEVDDHVDYSAGYVTADDNYTWICPPCFDDFKERFGWTVVESEA
jgi:hypothetical protein